MSVSEEGSYRESGIRSTCSFCFKLVDRGDPTIYREVTSWVHGPKLDGPVLRGQTGNVAHEECIQKAVNGQSSDQEELKFE